MNVGKLKQVFPIFPYPDARVVSAPRAGLPGLEDPNTPYSHFLTGARHSLAETEPLLCLHHHGGSTHISMALHFTDQLHVCFF